MGAGGKGGAGVYQAIINELPVHERYVELFAGYGAILRHKRPAPGGSVAVDMDARCCEALRSEGRADVVVYCGDVVAWLDRATLGAGTLVYADPPYLGSVRKDGGQGGRIYEHEMLLPEDHWGVLFALRHLRCDVAISHPMCDLYDRMLGGWRRVPYSEPTRGGGRTTVLWMNYRRPEALHDARYVGCDYRARENLARRIKRWRRRIEGMPRVEWQALREAILEVPADSADLHGR